MSHLISVELNSDVVIRMRDFLLDLRNPTADEVEILNAIIEALINDDAEEA